MESQRVALDTFFNATNLNTAPRPRVNLNWGLDVPRCCWDGVGCDGPTFQSVVVALNASTFIRAQAEVKLVVAEKDALCGLSNLTLLDMSGTTGPFVVVPTIPECLSRLPLLEHVDLTDAGLGYFDTIFSIFRALPHVRKLSLAGNGELRSVLDDASVTNWPQNLTDLSITDSGVGGTFGRWFTDRPWVSFSALHSQMEGRLPESLPRTLEWFSVGRLAFVSLTSAAQLYGAITDAWCDAVNLRLLVVRGTAVGGTLPECMGRWTRLRDLDLSFSFVGGRVPASAAQLLELQTIALSDNLFTDVEPILSVLSKRPGQLRILSLDRNPLGHYGNGTAIASANDGTGGTGASLRKVPGTFLRPRAVPWSLPASVFDQTHLEILSASHAGVAASLSRQSLGGLPAIRLFDLGGNALTGELPDFTSAEHLTLFSVSGPGELTNTGANCSVQVGSDFAWARSGSIASPFLQRVDLSGQMLCGAPPAELLRDMALNGAQVLDVSRNQFDGDLTVAMPQGVRTNVTTLGVSGMPRVTGSVTSAIAAMPQLQSFDASGTGMQGRAKGGVRRLLLEQSRVTAETSSFCQDTGDDARSWLVRGSPANGPLDAACLFSQTFESVVHSPTAAPGDEDGFAGTIVVSPTFVAIADEFCPPPAVRCSIPGFERFNSTLRGHAFLQELRLARVRVVGDHDAFFRGLCLFFQLKALDLSGTNVDADVPACLSELVSLVTLNLGGTGVPGISPLIAGSLAPAAALFGVFVEDARVTTGDAADSRFQRLAVLRLTGAPLRGRAEDLLRLFLGLPALVELDLARTPLTGPIDSTFFRFSDQRGIPDPQGCAAYVYSVPGTSARCGGPQAVGDTFSEAIEGRTTLTSVYDPPSTGFVAIQRISFSGANITGMLPQALPPGLTHLNLSYVDLWGEVGPAYGSLTTIDLRGVRRIRGGPLSVPLPGASALDAIPAAVRGDWTDEAVRRLLGGCCGLPSFLEPSAEPKYSALAEPPPRGYTGAAECRAVRNPANPAMTVYLPDWYSNYVLCRCAVGSYGFGHWCQKCPVGSTTAGPGAQSESECVCGAGQEVKPSGPGGSLRCADCAMGTYRPSSGGASCVRCPANSTTAAGGGQSAEACVCDAGHEPVYRRGAGSRLVLESCRPCGVMRSKLDAGNAACRACEAGLYALGEGSLRCAPCDPVGARCDGNGSAVTFLPGAWAAPAARLALPVSMGRPGTEAVDVAISPGGPFLSCPNALACTARPGGLACAAGFDGPACAACAPGHTSAGWAVCVKCDLGVGIGGAVGLVLLATAAAFGVACLGRCTARSDRRAAALRLLLELVTALFFLLNGLWHVPHPLHRALFLADLPALPRLLGTPAACFLGVADPTARQLLRLAAPFVLLIIFLGLIHPWVLLAQTAERDSPLSRRVLRCLCPCFADTLTSSGAAPDSARPARGGQPARGDGLAVANPVLPARAMAHPRHDEGEDGFGVPPGRARLAPAAATAQRAASALTCCHERSVWCCTRPSIAPRVAEASSGPCLVVRAASIAWAAEQFRCASLGEGADDVLMAEPMIRCSDNGAMQGLAVAVLLLAGLAVPLGLGVWLVSLDRAGRLSSGDAVGRLGFLFVGFKTGAQVRAEAGRWGAGAGPRRKGRGTGRADADEDEECVAREERRPMARGERGEAVPAGRPGPEVALAAGLGAAAARRDVSARDRWGSAEGSSRPPSPASGPYQQVGSLETEGGVLARPLGTSAETAAAPPLRQSPQSIGLVGTPSPAGAASRFSSGGSSGGAGWSDRGAAAAEDGLAPKPGRTTGRRPAGIAAGSRASTTTDRRHRRDRVRLAAASGSQGPSPSGRGGAHALARPPPPDVATQPRGQPVTARAVEPRQSHGSSGSVASSSSSLSSLTAAVTTQIQAAPAPRRAGAPVVAGQPHVPREAAAPGPEEDDDGVEPDPLCCWLVPCPAHSLAGWALRQSPADVVADHLFLWQPVSMALQAALVLPLMAPSVPAQAGLVLLICLPSAGVLLAFRPFVDPVLNVLAAASAVLQALVVVFPWLGTDLAALVSSSAPPPSPDVFSSIGLTEVVPAPITAAQVAYAAAVWALALAMLRVAFSAHASSDEERRARVEAAGNEAQARADAQDHFVALAEANGEDRRGRGHMCLWRRY